MERKSFTSDGSIIFHCYETIDGGVISVEWKGDCKKDKIFWVGSVEDLKTYISCIKPELFIS